MFTFRHMDSMNKKQIPFQSRLCDIELQGASPPLYPNGEVSFPSLKYYCPCSLFLFAMASSVALNMYLIFLGFWDLYSTLNHSVCEIDEEIVALRVVLDSMLAEKQI